MDKGSPVVWVTGAGGFIGHALQQAAVPPLFRGRLVGWTHRQLPLEDFPAVDRAWNEDPPDGIIHCAALSRGPACQADPQRAELLNVDVTRHLCNRAAGIPMMFLSTDQVFDGRRGDYAETDAIHPLSVYAETKARAEGEVLRNPKHTVVRLALNTGSSPTGDRSFTEVMHAAWARGETLTLFTDEFRTPIPAAVTARALWELFLCGRPGLYHLGGTERLSRYELGQMMAKRWPELTCRIVPGSLRSYRGASRAPDLSLRCAKIQAQLSFPLPKLTEWLAAHPEERY